MHYIIGTLGSGKGRHYNDNVLLKELKNSDRPIFTNFAIELMPWINGNGKMQLGLLGYILHILKDKEMLRAAENRIFRVDDEIIPEFFLYRAVRHGDEVGLKTSTLYMRGKTYDIYKAAAEYVKTKDDGRRIKKFDLELLDKGYMHYHIDEAWKFWGARDWDTTSKAAIFYAAHSRKTGDEVYITSHSTKDLDSALIRKGQDFHECINRSKRKVWGFCQPNDIKVRVTTKPPTGSDNDNVMETFTLDMSSRSNECYDTTGGLGIGGRMRGDMGEKKSGLPFWVLMTAAALVPLFAFGGLFILYWHFYHHPVKHELPKGSVAQMHETNTVAEPYNKKIADYFVNVGKTGSLLKTGNLSDTQSHNIISNNPPEVTCTGYIILKDEPQVFLSDGDTLIGRDEVALITRRFVVGSDGVHYKIKPLINKPVENVLPSVETQPSKFGSAFPYPMNPLNAMSDYELERNLRGHE